MAQPPSQIYNAVHAQAVQYGVPDSIWEDVAYIESGYNPNAIGDNGTSFGLFQLHIGGQLPAQYNNNPSAVFDPSLNAQIAMPDIAGAWNGLKSSFNPSSQSWWQSFAAQSGHPGGSPGQTVTDNEATKLQSYYVASNGNTGITPFSATSTSSTGDCCNGDIGCQVCVNLAGSIGGSSSLCCSPNIGGVAANGITDSISNSLLTPIETFVSGALPKVGLFILALIMVIIGVVILKK